MRTAHIVGTVMLCLCLTGGITAVATVEATPSDSGRLAQTSPTSGQVIGQPALSLTSDTRQLTSGTTTDIRIAITNRGEIQRAGPEQYENRVTTARATALEIRDDNTPFEIDAGTISAGNVPTGTLRTAPIAVTVPRSVDPGSYTIPVEYEYAFTRVVSYDSSGAEYDDFTRTRRGSITIDIPEQAQFVVTGRDAVAQVGDTRQIELTLENVGSRTASEASVTATNRRDELALGTNAESATAFVGAWAPGEQNTVTYRAIVADDAPQRSYTLDLSVDYTDLNGIQQQSRQLQAGVTTLPAQEFTLTDIRSSLRAGEERTLGFTVMNNGPQTIRNPTVRLEVDTTGITITTAEVALPTLAPDEQTRATFSADISESVNTSRQQFRAILDYTDNSDERSTSDPLRMNVPIRQDQDRFQVEPVNTTVTSGQTATIRLAVTNNGAEVLRSIDGQLFANSPLSTADDELFIDSLAPDETTVITLSMRAEGSALNKTYPASLDFQYDLPNGDTELSDRYQVPIRTTPPTPGEGPPTLLIGLVVIIAVAAVITVLIRRR